MYAAESSGIDRTSEKTVPVTEVVRLEARDRTGDDFERRLRLGIEAILRHPACLAVAAYRGVEEPDKFEMLITWTSIEDHRAWRDSPERAEYRSRITDVLKEPPAFSHYNPVELRPDPKNQA